MVMSTRGGVFGSGSGSGSSSDTELIEERIHEFVWSEVTHDILGATPVMLCTIKEGIMETIDKCLGALWFEITEGRLGAHTLSFQEFKVVEPWIIWG